MTTRGMKMTTMMMLLLLLPCSLAQPPTYSNLFSNSLIPDISPFPPDDDLFGGVPTFPKKPPNLSAYSKDAQLLMKLFPSKFQVPSSQSLPLSKYPYPQNQPGRPNLSQARPPQPNQYQPNPYPFSQPPLYQPPVISGSQGKGPTPQEVLALYYEIDRVQKGKDPAQYYKAPSPQLRAKEKAEEEEVSSANKDPKCQGFLKQYVCRACLAHKPCYNYCC